MSALNFKPARYYISLDKMHLKFSVLSIAVVGALAGIDINYYKRDDGV